MRLLSDFDDEKQAYALYSFLLKEGIKNIYEPFIDPETKQQRYHVWVYDEDDFYAAEEWLTRYRASPSDPTFHPEPGIPLSSPPPGPAPSNPQQWKFNISAPPRKNLLGMGLTRTVIIICAFLFLWNGLQEANLVKEKGPIALQVGLTRLEQVLFFDYPRAYQVLNEALATTDIKPYKDLNELPAQEKALFDQAQAIPSWQGLTHMILKKDWENYKNVPLFEKIREGEVWRLFTPCLMHRDFLHIFFNMIWVWILGRQIEERLRKGRMVLLMLIIGIVANVAQYLMSGPYFLGFSGVVVGMAGFIWVRQRNAPWEGYPLHRSTLMFILVFVGAMFALELVAFLLQFFKIAQLSPFIANTAHIVGGLTGMLLGKLSFFARKGGAK